MPLFEYKALTEDGKKVTGVMEGDTERETRQKLRRSGVHVTSMISTEKKRKERIFRVPRIRRAYRKDLSLITRQFATLLASGVALTDALTALIEQIDHRALQLVFRDIREKVTRGMSIDEALEAHRRLFGNLYVSMVRAGVASGNLDEVLTRLADYMYKQNRLRAKVGAALTYPIVMTIIAVGVVIFLMTYVVPQIANILKKKKTELNAITEFVMGVSDFLRAYWWLLGLAVLAAYILYQTLKVTQKGRGTIDRILLRLPAMGHLFRKQAVSRFAITMSTLLRSGMPALESLLIVKDVIGNTVMSDALQMMHDKILEGADISTPLKRSGAFPPVVGYMVSVGEQTGQLDNMLERVAVAYDQEIEIATEKLTAIIEPVIIVFMAVVVGLIVISVILPLMQMTKI